MAHILHIYRPNKHAGPPDMKSNTRLLRKEDACPRARKQNKQIKECVPRPGALAKGIHILYHVHVQSDWVKECLLPRMYVVRTVSRFFFICGERMNKLMYYLNTAFFLFHDICFYSSFYLTYIWVRQNMFFSHFRKNHKNWENERKKKPAEKSKLSLYNYNW